MAIHAYFFWWVTLTHNIGHTELVVSVQLGFISRSAHARLQVSVYAVVVIRDVKIVGF